MGRRRPPDRAGPRPTAKPQALPMSAPRPATDEALRGIWRGQNGRFGVRRWTVQVPDDGMDDMPLEGREIGVAGNFQARAWKVMRQSCLNGRFWPRWSRSGCRGRYARSWPPSGNGYVTAWVRRCDSSFGKIWVCLAIQHISACRVGGGRLPIFPARSTPRKCSCLCRADAGRAAARQHDGLRQDAVALRRQNSR